MPLTVYVDGVPHQARQGQTVAALLLTADRPSWRTTRRGGRPRGLFCGTGVCHDCLVVVNGLPDVRACLRELREGDRIETQDGARLPARPPGADDGRTDDGRTGAGGAGDGGPGPR
ncbi:hypothetical protein BLA24_16135 [Streptomyces cinnamoneus]|uniref:Uncharacterized protein n=1 Tax=Streptomyces cinnamoneus TaxID=53446 RepID=A0A2G1XJ42_STRCJ|nr:hypothetical protein BLA24_16135 [Streptomyces cinnamoneus]PPT13501.1 proline dehydrogenase [Streptomyces cinnamoneus]